MITTPGDHAMSRPSKFRRARPKMPPGPIEVKTTSLPLAGNKREVWRLSILVLSLTYCRSKTATPDQLDVLTWAVSDVENEQKFREAWEGARTSNLLRAWDEFSYRTIRLGLAAGLLEWTKSSRVKLSAQGSIIGQSLRDETSVFIREKDFFSSFGIFSASGMWRRLGEISALQREQLKEIQ